MRTFSLQFVLDPVTGKGIAAAVSVCNPSAVEARFEGRLPTTAFEEKFIRRTLTQSACTERFGSTDELENAVREFWQANRQSIIAVVAPDYGLASMKLYQRCLSSGSISNFDVLVGIPGPYDPDRELMAATTRSVDDYVRRYRLKPCDEVPSGSLAQRADCCGMAYSHFLKVRAEHKERKRSRELANRA